MSKLERAINQVLRVAQNEYGEQYETKTRHDRITCVICNGKYSRQNRKVHVKSMKHKSREEKVIGDIIREVLYANNTKKKTSRELDFETVEKMNKSIRKLDVGNEFQKLIDLENRKKTKYPIVEHIISDSDNDSEPIKKLEFSDDELSDIAEILSDDDLIFEFENEITNEIDTIKKILSEQPINSIKKYDMKKSLSDSDIMKNNNN